MSNKALLTFILFLLFIVFIGVVVMNSLPLLVAASSNVTSLAGMLMILALIIYGVIYFWGQIRK